MTTIAWVCLHCAAPNESDATLLDCDAPGACKADAHSAWLECTSCGWETRTVRHVDGRLATTHTQASSLGTAGTA